MSDAIVTAALKVMGDNPAIQNAIIDYFRAKAESEQNKEWREVWHQTSNVTQKMVLFDRADLQEYDVLLMLTAQWSLTQQVGVIRAYIVPTGHEGNAFFSDAWRFHPKRDRFMVYEQAAIASDFAEVIRFAQKSWDDALDAWVARLKEINAQSEQQEREFKKEMLEILKPVGKN